MIGMIYHIVFAPFSLFGLRIGFIVKLTRQQESYETKIHPYRHRQRLGRGERT